MRFVHPDLLGWLESGVTVVTPTPLLASACQKQYVDNQLIAGRRSWPRPAIVSLHAWLQQLWRDARFRVEEDAPILLSHAQERILWEDAIQGSGVEVLDVGATARAAMDAAGFVAGWRLPLDQRYWEEEDAGKFHSWLKQVRNRCRDSGWLLNSELSWHVAESAARIVLPPKVVFAGFDERTKALQHLVRVLESTRTETRFAVPQNEEAGLFSLAGGDLEDEIDAAARWARARLEEQPNASIAILVQNLTQNRALVSRRLSYVVRPISAMAALSSDLRTADSAFYLHSRPLLISQPVVAAAFALLDFASPLIPSNSVSTVLHSPFFQGAEAERNQRAVTDARLRRLREVELTLNTIEASSSQCPRLNQIWVRVRGALRQMPKEKAEAAQWSRTWRQLLEAAGWPGDCDLSELETEAVRQFRDTLSSFDALALTAVPFTGAEALSELRSLASAEGPLAGDLSSPIQVMEPRAAASLRFDFTWLIGASELEWPPLVFSPAYVPLSLQRLEQIPSSTATGRWEQARRLTDQIRRSAGTLVLSFSAPDASEARLSSCFAGSVSATPDQLHAWSGKTVLQQLEISGLESVSDTQGPPVTSAVAAQGGTHLLKSQSACPFQAFARWRLNAEQVEEGAFSFDARDRGDFLHKAMAALWRNLKGSERLRELKELHLHSIVSDAVDEALASDPVATTFRVQLRKAEARRLVAVIMEWLAHEKQRTGAFHARDLESQSEFQLSRLSLRLRADRIDELSDGGLVVIDYKSGKADRSNLDGDRPKEPQLLVYAALLGSKVEGLYFASIRREEGGASGYGKSPYFGDGNEIVNRSWKEQLRVWTETVTKLARQFESGRAPVDPRPGACEYCHIKPICRIEESRREKVQEGQ